MDFEHRDGDRWRGLPRGDDDGGGRGVRHHEGHALRRIVHAERQVGGARLQRGEIGDDRLRRALHRHAHDAAGLHARRAQPGGERLRAFVQVAVGERALAGDDGHPLRGARGLAPDERVDGGVGRVRVRRAVPLHDHLVALAGVKQGQAGQGAIGLGNGGVEQAAVVRRQAGDRRRLEQIGPVREVAGHLVRRLAQVEVEVEERGTGVDVRGQQHPTGGLRRVRLQREDVRQQRVARAVAGGLDRLDDTREGDVAVRNRVVDDVACPVEHDSEGRIAAEIEAQRERVVESTEQPVQVGRGATVGERSHHEVVFSRVAVQQRGEAREQDREELGARPLGRDLECGGEVGAEGNPVPRSLEAAYRRASAIGEQLEHRRGARQTPPPRLEPALRLAGPDPRALPRREVRVLDRGRRQRSTSADPSRVEPGELRKQEALERQAIGDCAMQSEVEVVAVAQPHQERAAERTLLQVERADGVRAGQRPRVGLGVKALAQVHLGQGDRARGADHRHRQAVLHDEGGTPGFVPTQELGEGVLEGGNVEPVRTADADPLVANRHVAGEPGVEPGLPLGIRQW